MKRAALAGLLVVAAALPARATYFGEFFVHGKGDHSLSNPSNVFFDYWKGTAGFLPEAQGCQGLPYAYAAYDGTVGLVTGAFGQYATMGCWATCTATGLPGCDAGGNPCDHTIYNLGVGEQINAFLNRTGVTDLTIVAHSMGGNVVRMYLSRSSYYDWCAFPNIYGLPAADPFCKQLRDNQRNVMARTKVVMALHSPFSGSEAADVSKSLSGTWFVGWIFNWLSPYNTSLKDCTTSQMTTWNANYLFGTINRPWPTVSGRGEPLYKAQWIALGSALTASQVGEDWAHPEDYQLAGAAGVVPFAGGYSDGLVSWASQMAVGDERWRFQGQHDQAAYESGAASYVGNNHHHARLGYLGGGFYCPTYYNPYYGSQYLPLPVCQDPGCGYSICRGFPLGSDEAFQVAAYVEKRAEARCGGDGSPGSQICNSWCLP